MQSKTLYVTDLDGTLLNSDSVISGCSKALLNELAEAGAMVSIATARTPATAVDLFSGVTLNVPAVVMTGASLYDFSTNTYIEPVFLEAGVAQAVLDIYAEHGLDPFVYVLRDDNKLHAFHGSAMNSGELDFYNIRRDKALKVFHLDQQPLDADLHQTFLIFCLGNRQILKSLMPLIESVIGYPTSYYNDIFRDDLGFLEVFAKGVSKAAGLLKLKRLTGADRMVVFGDNINDIPMFGVADVGVAVENAFDEAKDKAHVVIGTNDSDAVARFIYKDFFGREP